MSERAIVLEVPDLSCELIRLRRWQPADAPELEKAWMDPAILSDSVAPERRSLRDARKWISRTDVRRRAGLALDLVIADANSDALLGEVSLYRFDKARRAAEMSWWLAAEARGRGIATRAVNLLATWALDGRLTAVLAEIKTSNVKSLELAARCGFDLLRPADESTPAVFVRRAPRPERPASGASKSGSEEPTQRN
ncbi:MAG: GNAT family N-acetyltransferase [Acidimicrobiaceae bacterium]|nr:GNAT family N-acetyltransferase [Acidimicrobiaceae bacterium]MYC41299.1 GNAT family N-acetyltransferase [Acidimicrobiaceae bacterium]MYC43725.1 GNAT family N-acetyltransferase [Acidimicrobiaceae bacterium]MYH87790.1 GNAT family N-acetyltransferase [Acidimicrobiaceae bacterium]